MKLRRSALRFLELLESRENPSFVPLPTTALANVSQFATIVLSSGQPTTIVVGENGTNAPTVSPTQLQVLQSTGTGFTVIQTIDASAPVGATFPYQVTDLAVGDFNVDGHRREHWF